jgi:hypothetical protein
LGYFNMKWPYSKVLTPDKLLKYLVPGWHPLDIFEVCEEQIHPLIKELGFVSILKLVPES